MDILAKVSDLARRLTRRRDAPPGGPPAELLRRHDLFRELLASNSEFLEVVARIQELLGGRKVFGMGVARSASLRASFHAFRMARALDSLTGGREGALLSTFAEIAARLARELETRRETPAPALVLPLDSVTGKMLDWVGGKAAHLAEVKNGLGLPTPDGFAVTTRAFRELMAEGGLAEEVEALRAEADPDDPESLARAGAAIESRIRGAEVPPSIAEALREAAFALAEKGPGPLFLSVRSSAVGEDSEASHAGQYRSRLNVSPDGLIEAWKDVCASLFSARALAYRLSSGLADEDPAMGALVLEMVAAQASGVLYSRPPDAPQAEELLVTGVFGLGPYAVDGTVTPDVFRVSRGAGHRVMSATVSKKNFRLARILGGETGPLPVPECKAGEPSLDEEDLRTLARYALAIEAHFGGPQDIEWARDAGGRLFVLQARPLALPEAAPRASAVVPGAEVLVSGGVTACAGVGSGPAFVAPPGADTAAFPEGAVLVVSEASPVYAPLLPRAAAIVADFGSPMSHLASVAREFGVPALFGTAAATRHIPDGVLVTVDAASGLVYRGVVPELFAVTAARRRPVMAGTQVMEALRRVASHVVPLTLTDPASPGFRPEKCVTLHDVTRYAHERVYAEMFRTSEFLAEAEGEAVRLSGFQTLDLRLVDLGGGVAGPRGGPVTPARIASPPLRAFLAGMANPSARRPEPGPGDLAGFFSVLREQMLAGPEETLGAPSYAIISDTYLNFSSRVGYHYAVLDCHLSDAPDRNYITFAFQGGAASPERRARRARAIATALDALGFSASARGDRVEGRVTGLPPEVAKDRLTALGRLLEYTRRLDMSLATDADAEAAAEAFLAGLLRP